MFILIRWRVWKVRQPGAASAQNTGRVPSGWCPRVGCGEYSAIELAWPGGTTAGHGRLALLAAGAVLPEPLDACRADTSVLCPARYSAGRPCCGPQPATRPVRRGERPCEPGVPRSPGPGGPRMLFALSECISRRVAPSSTTAMGVSGTFGWAVPSSRSAGMPSMPAKEEKKTLMPRYRRAALACAKPIPPGAGDYTRRGRSIEVPDHLRG